MSDATRYIALPDPFPMRLGGELGDARIAFETWGELDGDAGNAVLILTGLSPDAHAATHPDDPEPGWWEDMVGPGKAIDTDRFFVICVNSLGSCKGSTGPASTNPETGKSYRLDFPTLTLEDVAEAAYHVVRALGVERLHALVGPSMGGMSAQALAMNHPDAVRHLVLISTATRATPSAIALRSLQRELIRTDPEWRDGWYPEGTEPVAGMKLARKLGMITYRSAGEWLERFDRKRIPPERKPDGPFAMEFEIESYLQHHADRFTGGFDANSYLYLSRAMDLFDVAEHGGSLEAGLGRIQAEHSLVVGVESDMLFPVWQQRELAEGLELQGRGVTFETLPSRQGHDSFLVDTERFGRVVGDFLRET
jgi:homoserine O-acetyltransferase